MSTKSLFDGEEFRPYRDRWERRLRELDRRRSYYSGERYLQLRDGTRLLSALGSLGPRLYRGIKPLYLPLARAVDVDAGIIPGGWALPDPEEEPRARQWKAAMDTVFDWSDWSVDGVLYVHYGAQYGVSGLKVADLRAAKRVVVKPLDPTTFLLVGTAQYDATPHLAICVETRTDETGKEFEYAEVVTAEQVRTFRDGEAWEFDGRKAEYPNELGFVPFVEVDHIATGEALGEATYQKAMPLLDEVNELASYLADIIRKHAEAQWAVIGAEPSDMVKSGDNVWFIPQGGDVKALVAAIDVAGVLAFVQEIRDQVHGALPELAFDELKSKTQIATATLELQLMELVLKIRRCRPNYDHGLADALRMCGRAADSMGLPAIAVLDDEGLRFDAERPVLPLDRETELRLEQMELSLEQQRQFGATGALEGQDTTEPEPTVDEDAEGEEMADA